MFKSVLTIALVLSAVALFGTLVAGCTIERDKRVEQPIVAGDTATTSSTTRIGIGN